MSGYVSNANWNHVLDGTCIWYGKQYVCCWVKDRRGWFPVRIDWDNPAEVDVFAIKKNTKVGQCVAMRCTTPSVTAQGLCPRHDIEWSQAGSPDLGAIPTPAPAPAPGAGTGLAKAPPTDDMAKYEAERIEARQSLDMCRALKVIDQASLDRATHIAGIAKQSRDKAEATLEYLSEPHKEGLKRVKQTIGPIIEYYDACERALKDNIKVFLLAQDAKQDAALAAVAEQGKQASPDLLVIAHGADNAQLSSTMGATPVWKIVKIDMDKLPAEYKLVIPNEALLKAMLKQQGGEMDVPGVTIERDLTMVNRA